MLKNRKISAGVYTAIYENSTRSSNANKMIKRVRRVRNGSSPPPSPPPPPEPNYNVFFGEINTETDGFYFLYENGSYIEPEII